MDDRGTFQRDGTAVGAFFGANIKYAGGKLTYVSKYLKKPVESWGEDNPTLHIDGDAIVMAFVTSTGEKIVRSFDRLPGEPSVPAGQDSAKLAGVWKSKTKVGDLEQSLTIAADGEQWSVKGSYRRKGVEVGNFVGADVKMSGETLTFLQKQLKKPAPNFQDVTVTVQLDGALLRYAFQAGNAAKTTRLFERQPDDADGQPPAKAIPELNRRVLKFAQDHEGEQVGNGECWTLAADALTSAGAQRPGTNGIPVYVFGRKLGANELVLPGDVLQFEKAKFVHKTKTMTFTNTFSHHTGIVATVKGKSITMLQQNYGGKKSVVAVTFQLDEQTEGTLDIFRPVPRMGK